MTAPERLRIVLGRTRWSRGYIPLCGGRPPESSNISFGTSESQTSLKCGQLAAREAKTLADFFLLVLFRHRRSPTTPAPTLPLVSLCKNNTLESGTAETCWVRGEAARVTNYNLRTNTITELRSAYGNGISNTARRRDEILFEKTRRPCHYRVIYFPSLQSESCDSREKRQRQHVLWPSARRGSSLPTGLRTKVPKRIPANCCCC